MPSSEGSGPDERAQAASGTRERILAASVAEFGAKGYSGARTAGITARAGVNQQLISYYFGGKQGLLVALLTDDQERPTPMPTVVFGARGNVGRHVAAGLTASRGPVRLTGRTPDASRVAADLDAPETLPAALAGASQVFLHAKPAGIEGFVTAARSAGVRHVVLLSSGAVVQPGVGRNPIARDHRVVESALEESGLSWTFIRPGMFATNTRWSWTQAVKGGEPVRLPYPDRRLHPRPGQGLRESGWLDGCPVTTTALESAGRVPEIQQAAEDVYENWRTAGPRQAQPLRHRRRHGGRPRPQRDQMLEGAELSPQVSQSEAPLEIAGRHLARLVDSYR
ncbi:MULTISPECIES: NAD(P)H-binding protein [unclassified Nonomuraea]|uniref:NAD(P)H-binding protein n=1 Tax=unclassified Nonomuraea TaxID=2593643 RepID=UPI003404ABA2